MGLRGSRTGRLKKRVKYRFRQFVVVPNLYVWAWVVLRCRRPCIIGVTGSVGKTTTKDMIALVLMHPDARPLVGSVWRTPGNLNDDVGLPLTVLGYRDSIPSARQWLAELCRLPFRALSLATLSPYPDILVLEYAAGGRWGNVPRMARLAPPTIAVVTTVGPAHLERFKTVERIAHEKGALVRRVSPTGLVVLGADSPYASMMEESAPAAVVKVPGRGVALSERIARVVGAHLGLPEEMMTRAVTGFRPRHGRLQCVNLGSMTVIDDSFNANPLSMELALDTLAEAARPGRRRVAILGIMAELGEESPRYHEEIGRYARERVDRLIAIGELARHYRPDHWFASNGACRTELPGLLRPGDCVLVKGSHSASMEDLISTLRGIADAMPGGCPAVPRAHEAPLGRRSDSQ